MKFIAVFAFAFAGWLKAYSLSSFQGFPTPATPSSFSVSQGIPSILNISDYFNFDQIFNSPSANPESYPIATLIKDFSSLTNVNSYQNWLPAARQSSSDYDSIPESLRENIQGAFEMLGKVVNATLSRGLERLEKAFGALNDTALSMTLLAENVVARTIQDIDNRISHYNETVRACIDEHISEYAVILPAARDGSIECVENKLAEGYEIIEQGRNDIAAAIAGAQNLSATIEQCSADQFNLTVFNCYTSALFHIRSETIFLPLQMTKRFGEMVQYVTSTKADLANCYIAVGETAAEQSLNATQTIANCLIE